MSTTIKTTAWPPGGPWIEAQARDVVDVTERLRHNEEEAAAHLDAIAAVRRQLGVRADRARRITGQLAELQPVIDRLTVERNTLEQKLKAAPELRADAGGGIDWHWKVEARKREREGLLDALDVVVYGNSADTMRAASPQWKIRGPEGLGLFALERRAAEHRDELERRAAERARLTQDLAALVKGDE